jgi:hypothetical protein
MASEDANARWQDLVAIRDDLENGIDIVVPKRLSRIDGKPRGLSPKAARFAQALAVSDTWSRISDARNRRMAA